MQRWKCAVGAIVVLAIAGGSVAACSKGGNTKQNAPQAKAKPKADPKAAKADPKAAKSKPPAKPAQTAANTKPAAKTAQGAAPSTKPAATAPAQKPAQTPAAATKPVAPNKSTPAPAPAVNAAATKPAPAAQAPARKPAAPAPVTTAAAKPSATTPTPAVEQTTASTELQANKTLVAQLQSLMPAGTDVVKASMGFRNLAQFVSAVHACHNLSIPFDKMRTVIVDEKKSLSAAIRALKPTASATIEAQRADYDARGMIYQAQHTETPAADSPAKKAKPSATRGVER